MAYDVKIAFIPKLSKKVQKMNKLITAQQQNIFVPTFFITRCITFCMMSFCSAIFQITLRFIAASVIFLNQSLRLLCAWHIVSFFFFFNQGNYLKQGSVLTQNITYSITISFCFLALIIKLLYTVAAWIVNEFFAGGK